MTVSVETTCGQQRMLTSPAAPHLQIKAPDCTELALMDIDVYAQRCALWLGSYLQAMAHSLALKHMYLNWGGGDEVIYAALNSAAIEKKNAAREKLEYVKDHGMLPFAWHGTTYFERTASRADLGPYDSDRDGESF